MTASPHRTAALPKLLVALACAWLAGPTGVGRREAVAGHAFEVGTGWQNMGASREAGWAPSVQGSRKDVPAYIGWRLVGERRLYWAPFARVQYTNFWSLGGAGNLLGVTLGPLGLGVHLTPPPSQDDRVPDPDAHRADLRREIAREGRVGASGFTQHYPLGSYSYVSLGLPIHFRAAHF
jgi:hypothetical protein